MLSRVLSKFRRLHVGARTLHQINMPISEFNPDPLADLSETLLRIAKERCASRVQLPYRSNFRVYALFDVHLNDGSRFLIEGANTEPAFIQGSVCAERNALSLLPHLQLHGNTNPKVRMGCIVSDSVDPLAPGLLCREFMSTFCDSSLPLVLSGLSSPETDTGESLSLSPSFNFTHSLFCSLSSPCQ